MRIQQFILFSSLFLFACSAPKTPEEIRKELQEKLINARPGDVIEIPEGKIEMSASLSLDGIDHITLRGAGMDKTILAFKGQEEGAEGIKIKSNHVVIEGLTVQDMKGDGIKVYESEDVVLRNLKVEWTNGPDTANGGYGLYPVKCRKILVEGCIVSGASDAGIYLGQSSDAVMRKNDCFANVQGIEAENCSDVLIYGNKLHGNTSGISVNNLPDLPVKNGRNLKVYGNEVTDNNLPNFGAPGSLVHIIPAGTGLFIVSGDHVEVFDNVFRKHSTTGIAVINFPLTKRPNKDSLFYPFSKSIFIHGNSFAEQGGMLPDTTRELGGMLAQLFQTNAPEIVFDGIYNPEVLSDKGDLPAEHRVCIRDNKNARAFNIDAGGGFKNIRENPAEFDCEQTVEVRTKYQ